MTIMNGLSGNKKAFPCECVSSAFIASDTAALEFSWPGPAPLAGQFFLIKPKRTGVFLGRPISVAGYQAGGSDGSGSSGGTSKAGGLLRFIIVRRGQGSQELADMRPGEEAELIGPLGNFWAQAEIPQGLIALVAGGVGIAPILAFVPELKDRVFDLYAGFRTGSFGLENIKSQAPSLRSLVIATEDGSQGEKGLIPDFFNPSLYSGVFACGPEPMLKVITTMCNTRKVPCYVSMERHMACGVGACLGCTVKTTSGNRRCCADGPIFNAGGICFDS